MSRSSELLGEARSVLAARLSASALGHCERVAATAVELARRFDVDAGDAELAGLLHDYAREVGREHMLDEARALGVPTTPFEREHPYLVHARLGAALVRRDLPCVSDAVIAAIEAHTVGAVPMSDLDRIVFLADMIEPGRTYDGVEVVRAACEAGPLKESFRVGYARTIRHLQESHRPVHPVSPDVTAMIERETGRGLFDPPAVV